MLKNALIIELAIVIIYLYYQNRKLKGLPTTTGNPETIFELDEDKEELIAEKDQAVRSKNEAEQEVLSLSNRLKNKQSEVSRKETEIERLQKELKEKVKEGIKPSHLKKLKRSKSEGDIPKAPPLPNSIPLAKSPSNPPLNNPQYPYTSLISQQERITELEKASQAKSDTIK